MTSGSVQARGLATRQRVLEAATAEFARHGIDGARINRIAQEARASKERIYAWFGDKEQLFDNVMRAGLEELSQAVPITTDLVGYTVRLHETFTARPELQRIAVWAWLHTHPGPLSPQRLDGYRHKVEVIRQAQRAGLADPRWPPHQLLAMLIAIATSWLMAPAELHQVCDTGTDHGAQARLAVRHAAERLVRPA